MGISRFLAKRKFKKYRKINESNLKKSYIFLTTDDLKDERSLISTINCAQYLMINSYDLFVLSYNYLSSKESWDKILFSRIIALYIIDFYDKIFPLIGRDLIFEANKIADPKTLDSIKIIGKKISKIKNENKTKLRHIRNVTIAHKSVSSSYLFEQIDKIDHKEIFEYSLEITGLMTSLSPLLVEILDSFIKKNYNGT